jgi:hypothetical protein
VKRHDTGKEHDKECKRSGQVWKVTMTSETVNRHNPFLSGEVWISGELGLKPPMGIAFPFPGNSKGKFIASGKYQ